MNLIEIIESNNYWLGPFRYKKYFEVYIESIQSKKKAA